MNVLLPAVGRKYQLAAMLKEALAKRGGRLIAADSSPNASGLHAADECVRLPPFDHAEFWHAADYLIREKAIDAVIPVRDAELAGWAGKAESRVITARIFISPGATLETCFDKWSLHEAAGKAGIPCPATMLVSKGDRPEAEGSVPVVVKPRRGAGGRGVSVAKSKAMLTAILHENDT